jgi:hypothetical protein
MKTENILVGLGLAGAAWFLYTRQNAVSAAVVPFGSSAPPPPGPNVTSGGSNPPAQPPPDPIKPPAKPIGFAPLDPATGPNFSQWVADRLGAGRRELSADEWNFLFSEFSKIAQTADLFNPDNRGEPIALSTYMQRRTDAGLSGWAGQDLWGFRPSGRYVQRAPGVGVR